MTKADSAYLAIARDFERREAVLEAAWAYEIALASSPLELEPLLDMAWLYLASTDDGFVAAHGLADGFVIAASTRGSEVLSIARDLHGDQDEIEFWRRYWDRIYGTDAEFDDDCRAWARRRSTLVPSAFMVAFTGDREFESDARLLLEEVRPGETERARFIRSLLLGAGSRLRLEGKQLDLPPYE